MTTVFISYRREDSADAAGRLRDRLAREFGADRIFFDVANIASGERFASIIAEKLASCDAVLAVIGKTWLGSRDAQGRRRIDAPDDWVRREIAAALDRPRIETIPVLVDEARMPRAQDLPPDVARLAEYNAHQLRHARYDDDVGLLIERLRNPGRRATSLWARLREVLLGRAAAASAIAIAFLMLLFAWMRVFDFFAFDTRIESYTMWLGEQFAPIALSPQIAIVAITEDTERALAKRFDRNWRGDHARLLRNLAGGGARAVAFDLEFREASDFDAGFIAAVESAKRSGTAVFFGARSQADWEISAVDGAASGIGDLCIGKRVGYASVAPLAVERNSRILSSLALQAVYRPVEVGLDYRHGLLKVRGRDDLELLEFSLLERVRLPNASCVAIQKGDAVAELMIRLSPLEGLRAPGLRYRYEDVISRPSLRDFAGRIILVGLQKQGEDKFLVRGGEERFGIELHAHAVNNLLSGINVHSLGGSGDFALTAAMAALGAGLRVWRPYFALRWRLILIAAVIAVYLALVVYVYQEFHILLNTVYHISAFVLAYWTVGRLARRWSA